VSKPITRTSVALARLTRTGVRKGVFEGSRGWLYVGLAATAVRVARWIITESEVVETVELKPGEAIEIRSVTLKKDSRKKR
jgi:hypothetical protein